MLSGGMEAASRPARKPTLGDKLFVCATFAVLFAIDRSPLGAAFVVGVALLMVAYQTDNLRLRKGLLIAAFAITIGFALWYQESSHGFRNVALLWFCHSVLEGVRSGTDAVPALLRGTIYPLSIMVCSASVNLILVTMQWRSPVIFYGAFVVAVIAGLLLGRFVCNYVAAETSGQNDARLPSRTDSAPHPQTSA